jgi:hypothetical protein
LIVCFSSKRGAKMAILRTMPWFRPPGASDYSIYSVMFANAPYVWASQLR